MMDSYAEVFGALIGRAKDEAITEVSDAAAAALHSAAGSEAASEASNVTYEEGEPDTGAFRFGSDAGFGSTFA